MLRACTSVAGRLGLCVCGMGISLALASRAAGADEGFTPVRIVDTLKILGAAPAFPTGNYAVENMLRDPNATGPKLEYASHGQGLKTYVDFDLGSRTPVAGFRHVQRAGRDIVAAAELLFSDRPDFGQPVATVPVEHVAGPGATTMVTFAPKTARYVRWQVKAIPRGCPVNVGGQYIAFYRAGQSQATPREIAVAVRAVPVIARVDGRPMQRLAVSLQSPYGRPLDVVLRVSGMESRAIRLAWGENRQEYTIPAIDSERSVAVAVEFAGQTVASQSVGLRPTRKATIYILPHSHTDIGYTELQTEIEDKQVNNLLLGMEHAQRTAGYPPGARFVWNVEVLWAADLYLRRLGEPQRARFLEAVKKGQVGLEGMYLNELTGLCRPEELMRLFRFATQLRQQTGATIDTAMISDVPGYTWGTVTAMRQAGIKYFSVAPNYFDRIGDILVQWENKPFYWVGPSADDKVLVWIPYKGYAMSHVHRELTPEFVEHYMSHLERTGYPYDIAYMRWAGHGDNALPDPAICEFVKEWSQSHDWPRLVISTTSEAFRAFDRRYGDKLPRVRGDWTPYWEDGAGSSALETAANRASSDRLTQAESLWAVQQPGSYPAEDFRRAWNEVLLYSEHTWGAYCSVSEPARAETREQWAIKQSYAVAADRQSRDLLSRALGRGQLQADSATIDVFNTTSWPRTDLVSIPRYLSEQRSRVLDDEGRPLPSQRLRGGELVVLARDVPPLAARRYTVVAGAPHAEGTVKAKGNQIENERLLVRVDPHTGGIVELRAKGIDANLVDTASGHAVNDYLYLPGDDLKDLRRPETVKIRVKESGPLVASLLVVSDAPGCHELQREIRLTAGRDDVELIDLVDKRRLEAASYHAKEGKESVNFAFPFHVPGGQVRLEVPYGLLRPDAEQIPGSCKNWFTVNRWADVSNADYGVTWVTLDAPLVQVGGITATLLNSQTNPAAWRKQVGSTQKLYCWAMNNHWGTNYRAYQEGPVAFRFILQPHGRLDPGAASRLAIGLSQPLLAAGARGQKPAATPRFTLDSADVLVTGLKPSDDGRALIVRLWGAAGRDVDTRITWSAPVPRRVSTSDVGEQALAEAIGPIRVPGWGVVTLRAELADR